MIRILNLRRRAVAVLLVAAVVVFGEAPNGVVGAEESPQGVDPARRELSGQFAEFWHCGWAGCKGWKGVGSVPDISELPDDLVSFMASCWDMTIQGHRMGWNNPSWEDVAERVWGERKAASVRSAGEQVAAFFFFAPDAPSGRTTIKVVDRHGRMVGERTTLLNRYAGFLPPPALSDDGRLLLFYDARFPRIVDGHLLRGPSGANQILNLATGELLDFPFKAGLSSTMMGRRTFSPRGTYLAAYGPPYRDIRMHNGRGDLLWTIDLPEREDAWAIVFFHDETKMAVIMVERMSTGDEPAPRAPNRYYLAIMNIHGQEFARLYFPWSDLANPGSLRMSADDRYVCVGQEAQGLGPGLFFSVDDLKPRAASSKRRLKAILESDQ